MSKPIQRIIGLLSAGFTEELAEALLASFTPPESKVLMLIGQMQPVGLPALAKAIEKSPQHTAAIVSKLKKLKLVSSDRRGVAVFYTIKMSELGDYLRQRA